MINPDKQVSDMDTVANVAPSKGRRRLVKGLIIATPAVVTIRRGYAQALSSLGDRGAALTRVCDSLGYNPDDPNPAAIASFNTAFPNDRFVGCPPKP